MTNSVDTRSPARIEYDNLVDSLTVLSKVKQGNKVSKIRIIEGHSTLKIALEDRPFEKACRAASGDGCKPTRDIIDKIMTRGCNYAVETKKSIQKAEQLKLKEPHKYTQENEKNEKIIKNRYHDFKLLLVRALHGMSDIRDLYWSNDEGEIVVGNELTEKIDLYYRDIFRMFDATEKPRMPDLEKVKAIPPTTPTIQVITQAAISTIRSLYEDNTEKPQDSGSKNPKEVPPEAQKSPTNDQPSASTIHTGGTLGYLTIVITEIGKFIGLVVK